MLRLTKFISVCSKKDIETWKVASQNILKHIDAEKYTVIVPDRDIPVFKSESPDSFEVVGESIYVGDTKDLLKTKLSADNQDRVGWFLQQFIKLAALKATNEDDFSLIWDADTVPLKPLSFSTNDGKVRIYNGSEHNLPYFEVIRKLLGMEKIISRSFVAQCIPIKGKWTKDFFNFIEDKHNTNWIDAIIDKIDFSKRIGFSEYETLGTYITHKYPDEFILIDSKWLREGVCYLGSVKNINRFWAKPITRRCDFASFESWDTPLIKTDFIEFIKNLKNYRYSTVRKKDN